MKFSPASRSVHAAPKAIMLLMIFLVMQNGVANATCTSLMNCSKSDIRTAGGEDGCDLLFIQSRHKNCVDARANLHGETGCPPPAIPACGSGQDNKAILKRLQACLQARTQQQAAFTSGLADIDAALRINGFAGMKNKSASDDVYSALMSIKSSIQNGQAGHAQQIQGVENAIAACK